MTDQVFLYTALGVYFAGMILIGWYAYRKTTGHEGYMLAGRSLPPWVAALSAGASDMSGWLMMGLPGAIYLAGLIEAWIAVGLTIGSYLNWRIVAPRLRAYTQVSRNSITVPSFFENRTRDRSRLLRIISSSIILIFFTPYIASGMVAGGKFFVSAFNGNYVVGLLIVTLVTLSYTLFGGFLGASYTDVAQGLMLAIAVLVVPITAIVSVGGVGEAVTLISTLRPDHFNVFGGTGLTTVTVIGVLSGLAWGLGYFGQPHIIVRFMALQSPQAAKSGRRIGLAWQAASLIGAVVAGLVGVAFVEKNGINLADPETVLLMMAQALLHPLIAGLVLAAVLAAIMSTFSSQLIVCSSALVEDIYKAIRKTPPPDKTLVLLGRLGVLLVTAVAILFALDENSSVLSIVSFAWAGFGASFGPVVILSLYWRRLTNWGALAGMIIGAITVFAWSAASGGIFELYELLPGFLLGGLATVIVSLATYRRDEEIEKEFDEALSYVKGTAPAATTW